jgi:hypothetical protein
MNDYIVYYQKARMTFGPPGAGVELNVVVDGKHYSGHAYYTRIKARTLEEAYAKAYAVLEIEGDPDSCRVVWVQEAWTLPVAQRRRISLDCEGGRHSRRPHRKSGDLSCTLTAPRKWTADEIIEDLKR